MDNQYPALAYALAGIDSRRPMQPEDQWNRRRLNGAGLVQMGTDTSPVYSPWQGINRLAQGAVGGLMMGPWGQPDSSPSPTDTMSAYKAMPTWWTKPGF